MQKKYIEVDIEEVLASIFRAKDINNDIYLKLKEMYINVDNVNENGKIELDRDSELTKFIVCDDMINKLSLALIRAMYDHNHEMRKRIEKHLRNLIDIEICKGDSFVVVDLIMADSELREYINKYVTFEEYINSKERKKPPVEIIEPISKGYVIM